MKTKKLIYLFSFLFVMIFASQNLIFAQNSATENNLENSIEQISVQEENPETQFKFTNSQNQNQPVQRTSGVWAFIKMILVLILVIVCIYFLMNFMKKSITGDSDKDDPYLRKVAQVSLAPGKSVQVVTLLENCYVVGVSDSAVNLLGTIEDKELINAMNLSADKAQKTKKARNFGEVLEMFMPSKEKQSEKYSKENIYSDATEQVKDFVQTQRKRVNRSKSEKESSATKTHQKS